MNAVPGELSAKIKSRKPKGLSTRSPPTSSAATAIPAARLIASRRNSGTRRKANRAGICSLLRTLSDIAARLRCSRTNFIQNASRLEARHVRGGDVGGRGRGIGLDRGRRCAKLITQGGTAAARRHLFINSKKQADFRMTRAHEFAAATLAILAMLVG